MKVTRARFNELAIGQPLLVGFMTALVCALLLAVLAPELGGGAAYAIWLIVGLTAGATSMFLAHTTSFYENDGPADT